MTGWYSVAIIKYFVAGTSEKKNMKRKEKESLLRLVQPGQMGHDELVPFSKCPQDVDLDLARAQ